jgi:tetratricopeptide (TPR) repeat protein
MRELGNSYLLLADGWFTKGNPKAAVAQYQEGLEILSALPQSGQGSIAVRSGMQRGYARLCNFLLSTGDQRGAIENCEKAVKTANELVASNPADPAVRGTLAATYGQMGNALRIGNRPKEAIPQLELAGSEFQKLLAEQPDNSVFTRNFAGVYTVLGNTYIATGEPDKAIESFQKSIAALRGMIKADPADARPKITLAVSLIRLAAVLPKAGRTEDARKAGAEGLAIFRGFADRRQASPDDLNNYASHLSEITVPELRDPKTVLAYSKRAVAGLKEPDLVYLSTLADAYFGVGDLENAMATALHALDANPAPEGSGDAGVRGDLVRKLQKWKALR